MTHADLPDMSFSRGEEPRDNSRRVSVGNLDSEDKQEKTSTDSDRFVEGETYTPDELLTAELEHADQFELTVQKTLAVKIGEKYISFDIASIECVDVTDVDSLGSLGSTE